MLRYQIKCARPGAIIDGAGMIQCVVSQSREAALVVYVRENNAEKFEKILNAHPQVVEFFSHKSARVS